MSHFKFTQDETVAVITLDSDDNRFNTDFNRQLLNTLDVVEKETDAATAVFISAHEKIFSNGIDIDWLLPIVKKKDTDTLRAFFYQLDEIFTRMLTYPLLTVAAISGHAFANGAIFCGAFDFRFMRSDRGYFCLPEVDLGVQFLPGMNEILRKAVPVAKLEEMQLTGCRLTAQECLEHGIVKSICPGDELLTHALAFAKSLNKKRDVVGEMKRLFNRQILDVINNVDPVYIEKRVKMAGDNKNGEVVSF